MYDIENLSRIVDLEKAMKVNVLNLSSQELAKKIVSGEAGISIHGFGYVGAAIASAFLRKDCKIVAHDIKNDVVTKLNLGTWKTFGDKKISKAIKKGFDEKKISATINYKKAVSSSTFHIITVPVLIKRKEKKVQVDLSQMISVCKNVGKYLVKGDALIIETTLPPGTTRDILKNELEKESKLKAGSDFALIYSPERILVGRALDDIENNYPKVVSGLDKKSLEIGATLYSIVAGKGVLKMSSLKAAETEKVFEGIYRDVNIALANELSDFCIEEGLNYQEIMNVANSQPYSHLHKPGIGVGGACIPVYPYFVLTRSKSRSNLIYKARRVNERRPTQIAIMALKDYVSKYGSNRKPNVAILGLSFRGDVADNRFSPTLDLARYFFRMGCDVRVHDPFTYINTGLPNNVYFTNSLNEALKNSNIVIVATDHSEYKKNTFEQIKEQCSKMVIIEDPKQILK